MALPTAATPGYTSYPGVLYGPDVTCVCLKEWLYWFRKLCVAKGYGDPVVWQLTGANDNSGGTHSQGGTFDLGGLGNSRAMTAREMGAVTWPRDWVGNRHTHGIIDCPHNDPARYQRVACMVYRRDGLGYRGLAGPDPLPAPSKWRTRQEGIDWAKAELARITGQQIIDNLETVMALSADDKAWLSAQFAKMPWTYKNAAITERDAYDHLLNPGRDVWDESYATHDGVKVSMKQEVADIKTQAKATAGAVTSLAAKVDTLKDGVANLVTLIQESHPKADPDPEPAPLPVPATQYGVDVSGHQTLEQVKAACANAKYGFAIVKATEGLSYDSPAYAAQMAAVRDSGKCAGAYHFAWPNQDPLKEAEHFVRAAALKPGELACLDVENWPEITDTPWTQRLAYTLAWLREVKRLTGATPLVYANWDWIKGLRTAATVAQWDELVTFPLWIAQYRAAGTFDTVSPKTGSANGWPVVMHQWTNNDGGLDGNFMPDPAAWADYALPNN